MYLDTHHDIAYINGCFKSLYLNIIFKLIGFCFKHLANRTFSIKTNLLFISTRENYLQWSSAHATVASHRQKRYYVICSDFIDAIFILQQAKLKNPKLKILLAVGGAGFDNRLFSGMRVGPNLQDQVYYSLLQWLVYISGDCKRWYNSSQILLVTAPCDEPSPSTSHCFWEEMALTGLIWRGYSAVKQFPTRIKRHTWTCAL